MHWNQMYVGSRFLFTTLNGVQRWMSYQMNCLEASTKCLNLWMENGGNSNQAHRQWPGMLQQNWKQGIDMMRIGYCIGAETQHEFNQLMQRECDALKEDAHQAAEVFEEAFIHNHRGKK